MLIVFVLKIYNGKQRVAKQKWRSIVYHRMYCYCITWLQEQKYSAADDSANHVLLVFMTTNVCGKNVNPLLARVLTVYSTYDQA